MPSYVTPKKGVEYIFYLSLVSQANTKVFQSNPTLAAGDFKVSIDGGALANPATLPAVTPASSKLVKVTLSTSEMNGDNVSLICSDASGAEWCDLTINIQTTAQQIDDLATQASVNTIDDFLDTEIAAIKAKTDNLPTDPADESNILAAIAGVQADTNDIQTRLPAALTAGGSIKAALQNEAHGGVAATLILEHLEVISETANTPAVILQGDGSAAGLHIFGGATGDAVTLETIGGGTAAALNLVGVGGDADLQGELIADNLDATLIAKIADAVLRRTPANVEASSDGDAIADAGSLYGLLQQARQSNTVDNAGFLTVYETDGTTELEQIPLATDASADPIVGTG